MKIGFDGKRFFFNMTGLGNYSRSTISQLGRFYPENSYHLFTPKITDKGLRLASSFGAKVHTPGHIGKIFSSLWRSVFMEYTLANHNLDIYHGLSHELPLLHKKSRTRRIVTMHDLIFIRYPELYGKIDAFLYTQKYRTSCHAADLIIATSEQTKTDLIDFFHISPQKIKIVYQSCDPIFYDKIPPVELQKTITRLKLPSAYLLSVGSLAPRKQPEMLIQALSALPQSLRLPLIFVGNGNPSYVKKLHELVNRLELNELIRFQGRAETSDLPAIYQAATVFLYPSLFEGFGIPILEALFSETPVITSDAACMREVGGTNSIFINPTNPDELVAALTSVLENDKKRNEMAKKGREFAMQFHEKNSAASLISCYREII